MNRTFPIIAGLGTVAAIGAAAYFAAPSGDRAGRAQQQAVVCKNDEAGLSLPPGFCATIFADNVGHARHMAVAADGTVYVNTWMSRYFRTPPPEGGFIVALRDEDGDGKAERIERFGTASAGDEMGGGTGIAIWKDGLFVQVDDRIVRYQLREGEAVPSAEPTVILQNLRMDGDHMMKAIAIDEAGNLFINSGSPSNVCEQANRQPGSPGKDPCDELEQYAGIWKYSAAQTGQTYSASERYATGIRNTGGITFDGSGRMFAMQHGRDQLSQNWPDLYTTQLGVDLPAEELLLVNEGDDFGWPYCYYDGFQNKRVLAPEYGGDGGKAIGRCADKQDPAAIYPAHWAPTDLAFYAGGQFPAAYKGGVFIAFHGSWNRAPMPQDGFNVVFQPLADGRDSGEWILFADGFAGPDKASGKALNRPTGVAVGGDGALYISDDVHGRIWKVTYQGAADAPLAAASPAAQGTADAPAAGAGGEGPLPEGFTAEQVALGNRIYHGLERSGTCAGCHGADGAGGTLGPALTGERWLWGDGSVESLARVIAEGIVTPKEYATGMPARGGSNLSDEDIRAVAAYVWTLGQKE